MPKVIPRRLSLCAVAGVLATACTTTSPPPATPIPTPRPKDSAVAPAHVAARWTPIRSAGSWRYELHSTGAVSLSGDSSANSLPLGRTVLYTVSIAPTTPPSAAGPAFQLTGSVDSVAVTIPERIPTPTAGSNSKPHFQGAMAADGHVLSLSSNATTSCTNATDPLSAAAALLFAALPEGISPADSWTDTVTTTTCRGRMPLVTTAMRQYKAITDTVWQGQPALLIARTDSLTIVSRRDSIADTVGVRRDSTDTMEAIGSGRGESRLYVDPHTGVLLEATGTSRTDILVTTPSSRFPLHEEARQMITLLK